MLLNYLFMITSVIMLKLISGNHVFDLEDEEKIRTENIWKRYADFENDDDNKDMRSSSQSEQCLCPCNRPESIPIRPEIIRFGLPQWRLQPFGGQIQSDQPIRGQPQRGGQFQGDTSVSAEGSFPQIGISLDGEPQEISTSDEQGQNPEGSVPPGNQNPEGIVPQGNQSPNDIIYHYPSAEIPESKGEQSPGPTSVPVENQTEPLVNVQRRDFPQNDISTKAQYGIPKGGFSGDSQGNLPQDGNDQRQDYYRVIYQPGSGRFVIRPLPSGSYSRNGKPQGGIAVNSDANFPQVDMSLGNKGNENQGGENLEGEGVNSESNLYLDGMINHLQDNLSVDGQGKIQNGESVNGPSGVQGGVPQGNRYMIGGEDGKPIKVGQSSQNNGVKDEDGQSSLGNSQGSFYPQENSFGGNVDSGQTIDGNLINPQLANNVKL